MAKKVNVFDVAEYILQKKGKMTTVKLQKLVYYCQAWSLVWDDSPLFTDPIQAWVNGPVVPALFNLHQGLYEVEANFTNKKGDITKLNKKQKQTIDAILSFYGDKTSKWLVDLTHMESPWIEARKGLSDLERGENEIGYDVMLEYYSSLKSTK